MRTAAPVTHKLAYRPDPCALFGRLLTLHQPVLLHSAERTSGYGRYDIFSADPTVSIDYRDGIFSTNGKRVATQQPLQQLAQAHAAFSRSQPAAPQTPDSPFCNGFIGYFGYGLHQQFERQSPAPADPTGIPALSGGFYDFAVVSDHERKTTRLYAASTQRLKQVLRWLAEPEHPAGPSAIGPFIPSTSSAQYREQFAAVQSYLSAGDAYQINLAVHYAARYSNHPWHLYQDWVRRQPAPFSAYLQLPQHHDSKPSHPSAILSLSPERFLQIHDRQATVCPIKGTRARGATTRQDLELANQLRYSKKDLAENLMIVDLLRNDLGRVCETGSIHVPKLFELVAFSNVHHLVSTVQGKLLPQMKTLDVFRALFPSGSITGAPKIRAIDIINELEPVARSVYCGSVGYWDSAGHFDSSVSIRTAVANQQQLHLWGGGGVVADSQANAELVEIQQKIGRLLHQAGMAPELP